MKMEFSLVATTTQNKKRKEGSLISTYLPENPLKKNPFST